MEYPCRTCLVKMMCNNIECPIIDNYLTYIYNNLMLMTADNIRKYSKTTPVVIKKILYKLIRTKPNQWTRTSCTKLICFEDQEYKIWKDPDNKIEIIKKRR